MTATQWKSLGELVRRRHVLEVGIDRKTLDAVTTVVKSAAELDKLPARTIAALRLERTDGRRARLLFYRCTVSIFLPKEYR